MLRFKDILHLRQDEKTPESPQLGATDLTTKATCPSIDAKLMLERVGLSAIVEFGCSQSVAHGAMESCRRCHVVVAYYQTALEWVMQQEPIDCTTELLALVWQITQLLGGHGENLEHQKQPWFTCLTKTLWELAKRLKDESDETDLYLPAVLDQLADAPCPTVHQNQSEDDNSQHDSLRAIRITIYHCRALVCEQKGESANATAYYRKCLAVRPPQSLKVAILLRESALVSLKRLLSQEARYPISHSSSFSSTSSAASTCSNCGVEKKSMPVCAKCKTAVYCSVRCLVSHKPIHTMTCVQP